MESWQIQSATFLVIDDEPQNVGLLERVIKEAGYKHVATATSGHEALCLLEIHTPDIVLLDLHMPDMDGIAVMEAMQRIVPSEEFVPVLVLTADVTTEAKQDALRLGAADFVSKPFNPVEIILRIQNLLRSRFLQQQIRNQKKLLEQRVRERTEELQEAQIEILDRLAQAAERRDDDTGMHTKRVARTAVEIAIELGLPPEEVQLIWRAAPLHDLGKIGIPDAILLKEGPLTPEEFEQMKSHTTIGAQNLSGGQSRLLQLAEEIALTHHERWDGTGYHGMRGEEIPIHGRIVAVADVFDALTHSRPYKDKWTEEEALDEIASGSGTQFDPQVVNAFLKCKGRTDLIQDDFDTAVAFVIN